MSRKMTKMKISELDLAITGTIAVGAEEESARDADISEVAVMPARSQGEMTTTTTTKVVMETKEVMKNLIRNRWSQRMRSRRKLPKYQRRSHLPFHQSFLKSSSPTLYISFKSSKMTKSTRRSKFFSVLPCLIHKCYYLRG